MAIARYANRNGQNLRWFSSISSFVCCLKHLMNNIFSDKSGKTRNTTVTNLSIHLLTECEYQILQYWLKHGFATRPKEHEILAYAEDIWEQIDKANICNNNFHSKSKIENALRGLAFNLINKEDSRIYKDTNQIKVIKQL